MLKERVLWIIDTDPPAAGDNVSFPGFEIIDRNKFMDVGREGKRRKCGKLDLPYRDETAHTVSNLNTYSAVNK